MAMRARHEPLTVAFADLLVGAADDLGIPITRRDADRLAAHILDISNVHQLEIVAVTP